MGKVLVTGINGNVGSYVHQYLHEKGIDVVGGVTSIEKSKEKFPNTTLVEFDFLNKGTFSRALNGVDRVFIMRPPHIGKAQDIFPFIDAAKEHNIQMIVFLSLMGIEKNPIPPHYKIEKYLEESGVSYCHIRPGFFMQNVSGVHAYEIKHSNQIYIPAGKSICSFVDTKDIGYAISEIFSRIDIHTNKAYTLTGGETLSYFQIAEILTKILSREISYAKPSLLQFRQYMIKNRKLDKKMVNVMMMLYVMTRLGTAKTIHNDFFKITGRTPTTFQAFAMEQISAW